LHSKKGVLFVKKIRVLSTENKNCFTIGKEYEVIGERDTSDDGYKCEIVIVIDDEGDEFHICNQQEATYEIVSG
jgi:hypothetical protein